MPGVDMRWLQHANVQLTAEPRAVAPLPGYSRDAREWTQLNAAAPDLVSDLTAVAWVVPLILSLKIPLPERFFRELGAQVHLMALARRGNRAAVEGQLHSSHHSVIEAYRLHETLASPGLLRDRYEQRLLFVVVSLLSAAPLHRFTVQELFATLSSMGEPCTVAFLQKVIQRRFPECCQEAGVFRWPVGGRLEELQGRFGEGSLALMLGACVDGARQLVENGTVQRPPGNPRPLLFKVRHAGPGQPAQQKVQQALSSVLDRYVVDTNALSPFELSQLCRVDVTIAGQSDDGQPGCLESVGREVFENTVRAWAYAMSRGGSIKRSRWILRLGLAWTLLEEAGLRPAAAAPLLGIDARTLEEWPDGPRDANPSRGHASSFREGLLRLRALDADACWPPPVDDGELCQIVLSFLEGRTVRRQLTSIERLEGYLRLKRLERQRSRAELRRLLQQLEELEAVRRVAWTDGEAGYVCTTIGGSAPSSAGDLERCLEQTLAFKRHLLESLLWEKGEQGKAATGHRIYLIPLQRLETAFREVEAAARQDELSALEGLNNSATVMALLSYTPAFPPVRSRLPALDVEL